MKDLNLLEWIKEIKANHRFGVAAGEGVVGASGEDPGQREGDSYRVMKYNDFITTQRVREAKTTPTRSRCRSRRSRQYWGIYTTKFLIVVL